MKTFTAETPRGTFTRTSLNRTYTHVIVRERTGWQVERFGAGWDVTSWVGRPSLVAQAILRACYYEGRVEAHAVTRVTERQPRAVAVLYRVIVSYEDSSGEQREYQSGGDYKSRAAAERRIATRTNRTATARIMAVNATTFEEVQS